MVIIRRALEEDKIILANFYRDYWFWNNTKVDHEYMIILDKKKLLGFSEIKNFNNFIAEIINIYVNEDVRNQGLGDGLLRASMNYIEKNGSEWVVIQQNEALENFLFKKGLQLLKDIKVPPSIREYLKEYNNSTTLLCNIPLFFQKGCKNKKSMG
ncbi:GNAT family N-acetyltransferase [Natronincola ferrireducens]|uniref:Acetyltransferase (GNAT) domain-containing protein n=1 Tax=Natronincola ferrireducens TaxID=393762 RepID=A0A1G9C8Q5_9FIRM|nr:GNAT family N-acetyltransferase [Natronincola ferrireducens]SDK48036.1 Acetyltransferase (GNAT) domain-containing protein [Natronincola ferrireducens]